MAYGYIKDAISAPKVRTIEITFKLQKYPDRVYCSRDIMKLFGVTMRDGSHRLRLLSQWGILKLNEPVRGARGGYVLTEYGKNFKRQLKGKGK